MNTYDPLYVQFIYYFNHQRDYFECHEVMEELWLEEGRFALYQGLLQAAVALHHFSYDNISGARKLFQGAIDKMQQHASYDLGIDLHKFIEECRDYLRKLDNHEQQPVQFYDLDIHITDPQLENAVQECVENPPRHEDD